MAYELYNNANDIILYTACRIRDFYNIADFEKRAKKNINDYCRSYLEIDVKPNDVNNFYAIHNKEIINIVKNRKQLYKQYGYYNDDDDFTEPYDDLDIEVERITSYRTVIKNS